MIMTAAEVSKGLTQTEYEQLMNRLAGALHTQRRFIEILSAERVNSCVTRYKIKRKGAYNPYIVEEMFRLNGPLYLNLGVVI